MSTLAKGIAQDIAEGRYDAARRKVEKNPEVLTHKVFYMITCEGYYALPLLSHLGRVLLDTKNKSLLQNDSLKELARCFAKNCADEQLFLLNYSIAAQWFDVFSDALAMKSGELIPSQTVMFKNMTLPKEFKQHWDELLDNLPAGVDPNNQ